MIKRISPFVLLTTSWVVLTVVVTAGLRLRLWG